MAESLLIYLDRRALRRLTLISAVVALLGASGCIEIASNIAEPVPRSPVSLAPPEPGGSTYVYFDPGDCLRVETPDEQENCLRNIDTERQIKYVVNAYDEDPVRVRRQIAALFQNGQRIIATIIWHERLPPKAEFEGIIVSSREGRLPPRQRANLESLLRDIYDVGFREIHIRLAQKGDSRCRAWSSWNQDLYDENYAFLRDVRSVAYGVFGRTQPEPYRDAPVIFWFDLDLEVGSWMHKKPCERYVKELWSDYVDDYGATDPIRAPPDTYGFTFTDARWHDEAGNPRLKLLFEAYDAKGVRPRVIAFDLYEYSSGRGGPWEWLTHLAESLDRAHVARGVSLFVEETSYNSRIMAGFFRRARAPERVGGLGLNIRHIVQWPKEAHTGSVRAFTVATTERYDNFLEGPAFDFDGDGRADRAIWRPAERRFYLESSSNPESLLRSKVFAEGARPAPGDYDGDGRWDFAIWRRLGPDTRFEIEFSDGSADRIVEFYGFAATHAVLGDFDGDGQHDPAVYDAKAAGGGRWSIARSRDGRLELRFGGRLDIPVPFDWQGDRTTGIAAFRPATIEILRSGAAPFHFGLMNDDPVVSDYDGDGIEDFAVHRSENDTWYIRQSSDQRVVAIRFGCGGDIPVPADYDGDLKTDLAVFRPRRVCGDDVAERSWQYRSSATGETITLSPFGMAGDIPVQAAYLTCVNPECGYPR